MLIELNGRRLDHGCCDPLGTPLTALLRGYKKWLSPLLGQNCRFHPSCSDYARIALGRFGSARGLWLATWRVARCQPLCGGGVDPVPETFRFWPTPSNSATPDDPDE